MRRKKMPMTEEERRRQEQKEKKQENAMMGVNGCIIDRACCGSIYGASILPIDSVSEKYVTSTVR